MSGAAITDAGPVTLRPALVRLTPTGVALTTFQRLHHRALGQRTGVPALDALAPREAFTRLSTGTALALAHLAVLDGAAAAKVLRAVLTHGRRDTLDGLHPLFFAAALSTARAGGSAALDDAATLWAREGMPSALTGGALTLPVLDVTGTPRVSLVGAAALAGALRGAGPGDTLVAGLTLALREQVRDDDAGPAIAFARVLQAGALAVAGTLLVRGAVTPGGPLRAAVDALEAWAGSVTAGPGAASAVSGGSLAVALTVRGTPSPLAEEVPPGAPTGLEPVFAAGADARTDHGMWAGRDAPTLVVDGPGAAGLVTGEEGGALVGGLPSLAGGTLLPGALLRSLAPMPPELPSGPPEPPTGEAVATTPPRARGATREAVVEADVLPWTEKLISSVPEADPLEDPPYRGEG